MDDNKKENMIDNSIRTISHAYSIALTSYENKKKLAIKIKTDNIFNINHLNKINTNKKLLLKLKEYNPKNQINNINTENMDKNLIKEKDIYSRFKRNSKLKKLFF